MSCIYRVGGYVLKKIILTSGLTILLLSLGLFLVAGYFVGSYFVDFALLRGNTENPQAPPAACVKILDQSVELPRKPEYASEKWEMTSFDGLKLVATHFSPAKPSNRWVVIVHGYGRNQQNAWYIAKSYLARGYHVLTPDLRASGDSEGKYLTMGVLESDDILNWIEKIAAKEPQSRIVMHGVSMGAATVMMTSAKPLPANLVAAIEDCGYTDVYTMFSLQLRKLFDLPAFPLMDCVNIMCRIKAGFFLTDAAPIKAVPQTKVPMLFIHGDADDFVPYTMMQELYDASGAPEKDQLTVAGAGHAAADQKEHKEYYKKVFGFIAKYTEEK